MKRKYTDRQIASMWKKLVTARKLILAIEGKVNREADRVSDRIVALEVMRRPRASHLAEKKALEKYENKLFNLV